MKKTILSTVILTAITSTSANAVITSDAVILPNTTTTVTAQFNDVDKSMKAISAQAQDAQDAANKAQTTADAINHSLLNLVTNVRNQTAAANANANKASADVAALTPKVTANETAIKAMQPIVSANTMGIVTLVNDLDQAKKDQAVVDQKQDAGITLLTGNLGAEMQRRADADDALRTELQNGDKAVQATVDANKSAQDTVNKGLRADIDQNNQSINGLITDVQKAQDTADDNTKALSNKVDKTAFDTSQKQQDIALQNEVDARHQADTALDARITNNAATIGTKVDQTAFKIDQDRQDKALTDAVIAQGQKDQAQDTRMDGLDKGVQSAINGVATEKTDRKTADDNLQNQIDTKASTNDVNQIAGALGGRIDAEAKTREAADKQLFTATSNNASAIAKKVDQSTYDTDQKAQDTKISQKVDQSTFTADQQRQDTVIAAKADQSTVAGINTVVQANTTTIQTTTTTAQNNKTAIANNVTNITNNTTNITNNKTDITALQADQQTQNTSITNNTAAITSTSTTLKTDEKQIARNRSDIAAETKTEATHFATLSAGVKQAQNTGAYAQARADQAFANADANRQALDHTNKQVAANSKQLANHEARIQDLEANNQTNFNKLQNQQNHDRKEFRAGVAGAVALTQIPAMSADQSGNFGMAVGTFHGENAVAAGVSTRLSSSVSLKSGLSWDTQGNVGAGAGVAIGW